MASRKALLYSMNIYPIHDPFQPRFARLQKSRRNHRSYVWRQKPSTVWFLCRHKSIWFSVKTALDYRWIHRNKIYLILRVVMLSYWLYNYSSHLPNLVNTKWLWKISWGIWANQKLTRLFTGNFVQGILKFFKAGLCIWVQRALFHSGSCIGLYAVNERVDSKANAYDGRYFDYFPNNAAHCTFLQI